MEVIGFPDVPFDVREPPRSEFGDLSTNAAFGVAKTARLALDEAARSIGAAVRIEGSRLISGFDVHPSGYINFRVDHSELALSTLSRALVEPEYGKTSFGRGKKAIVEHTSVNPAHALHVGHLRNLTLGDSLARILRYNGFDVEVQNYIDDSGLQVADLIVGFRYAGFPLEPSKPKKYDQYCGDDVYVKVNELYQSKPELLERRKQVLQEIEEGDSATAEFARSVTRRVLREQLKTCWRMGARYDCLAFELHILETKLWDDVFHSMKQQGIARHESEGKYAGCWTIRLDGEGEEEEKVLLRSDGTATYVAKDIPYAAWKIGLAPDKFHFEVFAEQPDGTRLWSTLSRGERIEHPRFGHADVAVNVIDVRQSRLQRIVSYVLSKLGGEAAQKRYVHLGYEVVTLSRQTAKDLGLAFDEREYLQMSGRKGVYINADAVLDALHAKALEETRKRNPNESSKWLRAIAEKVAIAALRFELLKQDLDKILTFDLKEALNLAGETGPYLQYSHARACRILEKSGEEPRFEKRQADRLTDRSERALVKLLSKFDLVLEEAATYFSPKVLARYGYDLATAFNIFYENSPVLQESVEETRHARLALVKASQRTLKATLGLLGIEAPDRI